MTNDLLLAILSMDVYNRGSTPGLRVDATSRRGRLRFWRMVKR
jgi:hypothetical protein